MQRRHFDIVVSIAGVVIAVALVVFGIYFQDKQSFASNNVRDQLAAQKIYFPVKKALTPKRRSNRGS